MNKKLEPTDDDYGITFDADPDVAEFEIIPDEESEEDDDDEYEIVLESDEDDDFEFTIGDDEKDCIIPPMQ